MCITLTVVMVSWVCTYVQIQQITELYTVKYAVLVKHTPKTSRQTNQKLSLDSHCPESKIQNLPWISHNVYLKKLSFTSLILSSNLFPLSLCSSNTGFFFFLIVVSWKCQGLSHSINFVFLGRDFFSSFRY